ncbi:MAG: MFS transporter [Bacteroidaceae bacterium]|nr:MFS transporter [Bacteroidaceae bacterium]
MKPFAWVPTLYFAEAVPYMAVMTLSVILYTRLGLTNTQVAFYTSWLYLPWVIKPVWSPLVDALRTKRWWILAMQLLVGAALAGVAFTLSCPYWLQLSLAFFWLMAFSSATHDIAADGFYILALDTDEQAFYVGFRSTFYRIGMIFCQGVLVILAGYLERFTSVGAAWQITLLVTAALMVLLAVWHRWSLSSPEQASAVRAPLGQSLADTFLTFGRKPGLWAALLFMLLFRFPEAQLAKMAQPFMLRSAEEGGLGLTTADVGLAYGTIGVIGLLAGGIVGGWLVSRHGLRKWLWPMVLSISLPDAVYVYLAYCQPTNLYVVDACVAFEQLGYGFGFTAYSLFLVYFSRGDKSTSVFSLCTALQALGMMLPGMWAGRLTDLWGFPLFFVWVCGCTLVTFVVTALVKIPEK